MPSVIEKYKFKCFFFYKENTGVNNDITKPLYNRAGAAMPEKLERLKQSKITFGLGLSNLLSQELLAKPAEKQLL